MEVFYLQNMFSYPLITAHKHANIKICITLLLHYIIFMHNFHQTFFSSTLVVLCSQFKILNILLCSCNVYTNKCLYLKKGVYI
jgi:hypothetical protein